MRIVAISNETANAGGNILGIWKKLRILKNVEKTKRLLLKTRNILYFG